MKWSYWSENVGGNLHVAANYLRKQHPTWDVVAMECVGGTSTIIVYRTIQGTKADAAERADRKARNYKDDDL